MLAGGVDVAQGLECALEIFGGWGGEADVFPGGGMLDAELLCVKGLSVQGLESLYDGLGPLVGFVVGDAVDGIAEYGASGEPHVDAYLVGAAGLELKCDQGCHIEAFEDMEVCDGGAWVYSADAHAGAVGGTAADIGVDAAAVLGELAADEGEVAAVEAVLFGLLGEMGECAGAFGDDHEA